MERARYSRGLIAASSALAALLIATAPAAGHGRGPRESVAISQVVLAAENARIACDRSGAGPLVLLLHGWPQDRTAWRRTAARLSPRYTTLACDLPGAGASAYSGEDYSKRTLAKVMRTALVNAGLQPAYVAGHDIGGMVAYAYAAEHPVGLRAVAVLEATIPGTKPYEEARASPAGWYAEFHAVPSLPEQLIAGRERLYFGYFLRAFSKTRGVPDEEAIARYATAYTGASRLRAALGFYRSLPQDEADNSTATRAPVAVPLLGVTGGGTAPESAAHAMVQPLATRATGRSIPESGHWLLDERSDEVARILDRFFSQN